ncbi:MAG: alpha-galactosidase [Acidimicrobiales bacterium]|nr:alpha-galactosidase [Acidimicrobiales bacterium]
MIEPTLVTIEGQRLSATVAVSDKMPEIVSIGPAFSPSRELLGRAVAHGGLDEPVPLGIVAEESNGHMGRPGLMGMRSDGTAWSPRFGCVAYEADTTRLWVKLHDPIAQLELEIELVIDDVLVVRTSLTNTGPSIYVLSRLSPSIPVPATATELVSFRGRWAREFSLCREPWTGLRVVENRRGRTSHQSAPALIAGTAGFGEQHGSLWGVQLAWSGNHELAAEVLADGRRHIQAGELIAPGEVMLEPGQSYSMPEVVVAWSNCGLTSLSQAFHAHARSFLPISRPRPVSLNTWEAVYFDHDLERLCALADAAAQVGVERFILDDGWFGGRRNDRAGLGDWWVSPDVWPEGLDPLIDRVTVLGMEFGLWVEPEMVNPDSELYRAHPDWTLTTPGYVPLQGRHQLVLDLGRPEVADHLFASIDALLQRYPIGYLKWDMNRDIVQGSHGGRPGARGHVIGLYSLLDRIREAHPQVEIESCASGGGRADLAVLRRACRIWTSDCNDALERQAIQRGFSVLFPPEVMGSHIGPATSHTTGRTQTLAFRAATALFGHLGIEWNLLEAGEEDLARLAAAVAAHKRLRPLLHSGNVVRLDHPDPSVVAHGVVSPDATQAVFCLSQVATGSSELPLNFHPVGLDPHAEYVASLASELGLPRRAARRKPPWFPGPVRSSGKTFERQGLPLPPLDPETCLIIEFTAVN